MNDLLQEYRHQRKLARDRLYEARQLGANVWSFVLPDIPKIITQEDIDELIDVSKEILRQARNEGREDNDKYADDEKSAEVSILGELNQLITDLIELVEDSYFLSKTDGALITGRGGKGNAFYQDTDADKASIIDYWNDFFDEHTQTEEDARRLYDLINAKMPEISMLLNSIEYVDYKVEDYNKHITQLREVFNELGAPIGMQNFTLKYESNYGDLDEEKNDYE